MPILLSLLMGRRSRKMAVNTYIFTSVYWLITAIEASDLLETAMISKVYKHTIFTTEAIVSIVMIITNAYAIVTLCSFLTPSLGESGGDHKFDLIYRSFVGLAGIFFVESPMLIARFQIISTNASQVIHGSFYMWVMKDCLFVILIIIILLHQQFRKKYVKYFKLQASTAPFDNPSVDFEPEKRDVYIHKVKKVRFLSPQITDTVTGAANMTVTKPTGSILRKKSTDEATMFNDSEEKRAPFAVDPRKVNYPSSTGQQPVITLPWPPLFDSPSVYPEKKALPLATVDYKPHTPLHSNKDMENMMFPSVSESGLISLTNFPETTTNPNLGLKTTSSPALKFCMSTLASPQSDCVEEPPTKQKKTETIQLLTENKTIQPPTQNSSSSSS